MYQAEPSKKGNPKVDYTHERELTPMLRCAAKDETEDDSFKKPRRLGAELDEKEAADLREAARRQGTS